MIRWCVFFIISLLCFLKVYSQCETCNAASHFRCTAYNKYQFCDSSNNPVGVEYTCGTNTYCSTTFSSICQAYVAGSPPDCLCGICSVLPTSTSTIACVTDTQYAICYADGNVIPDTPPINCPANTQCSSAGTPAAPCVASTVTPRPNTCAVGSASICSQTGRFPVYGTLCKQYYLCTKFDNGTWVRYEYSCPGTSTFDPSLKQCSGTYICTG